jgi:3-oxoacyl-[acyl-carrier protein] reductase
VYQFAPLEQVTEEDFHRQFNTNVLGLVLATQEAVRYFGPEGGSVINVSSVASTSTPPAAAVYAGSKAAVDAITRVLAKELGPKNIRVNAIKPGPVETEGFKGAGFSGSDFEKGAIAQTPLGRIGRPNDIAPVAVFLASADSGWVTGEIIHVSRGCSPMWNRLITPKSLISSRVNPAPTTSRKNKGEYHAEQTHRPGHRG